MGLEEIRKARAVGIMVFEVLGPVVKDHQPRRVVHRVVEVAHGGRFSDSASRSGGAGVVFPSGHSSSAQRR